MNEDLRHQVGASVRPANEDTGNAYIGINRIILYGASITDADVIMSNGKSLEHVGVTPDELLLPNKEDLASERDPVMARAAALAGIEMNPKEAGTLFPIEWQ